MVQSCKGRSTVRLEGETVLKTSDKTVTLILAGLVFDGETGSFGIGDGVGPAI